jgi:acyl-CoA reductase-like NAD-dependent aldehyde dehydrogenase
MAVIVEPAARASSLPNVLLGLRDAQCRWAQTPLRKRVSIIRRIRHLIAERADRLALSIARPAAETLSAEVLPLAEACRFLERKAERLLAPRPVYGSSPLWLRSVRLVIHREPFGVVLIIGPGNYPLFLPGVQMLQALTAGNAVLMKPGMDGSPAAAALLDCLYEAGVPRDLVFLLDESPDSAQEAIRLGVDKVVLTGSSDTGMTVLQSCAPQLTPVTMELSGCDPVFVLPDADLRFTAAAIRFGVTLNSGNTCIRPRRIFAAADVLHRLRIELGSIANEVQLTSVSSERDALRRAAESKYALGASIFGGVPAAQALAKKVRAGVVVINDMIVPTAHPDVPFGGRGASGFGVTRGAQGLLELTTLKTIAVQSSPWHPHLGGATPEDTQMFSAFIRTLHAGSLRHRLSACAELTRALLKRRKEV